LSFRQYNNKKICIHGAIVIKKWRFSKMNKTREISASLRVAALNLDSEQFGGEIDRLLGIANELDSMSKTAQWGGEAMTMAPGVNDLGGMGGGGLDAAGGLGLAGGEETALPTAAEGAAPSKYGVDQRPGRYFEVPVEIVLVTATDNLAAREKVIELLKQIPELEDKVNVGTPKAITLKEK
jgi:hypothetical protein